MERRGREGGVRHIEKGRGEEGGRRRGVGPQGDGTQGQVTGERERERLEI